MRLDLEAFKRELTQHYAEMCAVSDDWAKQARRSCDDLARQYPSEFGDLVDLVRNATEAGK